jgi:hypothetical protein
MKTIQSLFLSLAVICLAIGPASAGIFQNSVTTTNDAGVQAFIATHLPTSPDIASTFYCTNYGQIFGIQPDGTVLTTNIYNHSWSLTDTNGQVAYHTWNNGTLLFATNAFVVQFTNAPTYSPTNINGITYWISNYTGSAMIFSNGQVSVGGSVIDMSVLGPVLAQVTNVFTALNSFSNQIVNVVSNGFATNKLFAAPLSYISNPITINALFTNSYGVRITGGIDYLLDTTTGGGSHGSFVYTNLSNGASSLVDLYSATSVSGGRVTLANRFNFDMGPNEVIKFYNTTNFTLISSFILK